MSNKIYTTQQRTNFFPYCYFITFYVIKSTQNVLFYIFYVFHFFNHLINKLELLYIKSIEFYLLCESKYDIIEGIIECTYFKAKQKVKLALGSILYAIRNDCFFFTKSFLFIGFYFIMLLR